MTDLEAELDRLYGLPLDEFVRARDDLARTLRRETSAADAGRVRALAKPSRAAWAANQLARRRGKEVDALVRAGGELRRAQGAGDAPRLEAAATAVREAVRDLVRAAPGVAAASGRSLSGPILDRLGQSLRAAAVDEQAASELAGGRLARDVEPAGFDVLAGLSLPRGRSPRRHRRPTKASLAAKQRARELDTEARRLEREADGAERAARRARERADAARQRATEASARASENAS